MTPKRLLIAFAHPDDESFGMGGLIGKYVQEGVEVYYIVATNGNKGTVASEFIQKYGSIEAVRDAEMTCASQVLGFKEVFNLGYNDSGMMGSDDNNDPDCLWQASDDEVTEKIVSIMRQLQPQVIITFDPYGGYGHPDHIKMHRAATRAFRAASNPAQFPEHLDAYFPLKLYYTTLPRLALRFFIYWLMFRGKNPRKAGENQDLDFVAALANIPPVTTKINIGLYLHIWDKASHCHASQVSPRTGMPIWLRRLLTGTQGLHRHYPERKNGEPIEKDVFEGIAN